MKRLFKWLSVFVGLVILTLVAAIVTVTSIIDPNQFKPVIISQFKQLTGFEMQIPGNLTWSFYPHFGMAADEVIINKPSVITSHLKNLVLRAKLGPLFHKQLYVSKASVENLQVNHFEASQVQAKISLKNQILEIHQLRAKVYQGALNADATVFLNTADPNWHVIGKLDKVDIAALLKGFSGKSAKLQVNGSGDFSWDVTTQGKNTDDLLSHLNGSGRVQIDKGSLKGIDIDYFVNTAVALINNQPLPTRTAEGETTFGQLRGSAIIREGVITTNNLVLDSSFYMVEAVGSIDLVNKTLDYYLNVSSKLEEKTNKAALALYGKKVPIRVSGDLSNPAVSLDTLALMKEVGKEQLQRVGQEIQKRLPDKANAFIKSLFQ